LNLNRLFELLHFANG
jgi:hypothetical protein